jgi:hypothetical protein
VQDKIAASTCCVVYEIFTAQNMWFSLFWRLCNFHEIVYNSSVVIYVWRNNFYKGETEHYVGWIYVELWPFLEEKE